MQTDWQDFLAQQGGIIVDDRIAHFGDARRELVAARDATVVCDLSQRGLILASGEDAQAFLHGQFTNDVTALGEYVADAAPDDRVIVDYEHPCHVALLLAVPDHGSDSITVVP